MLGYSRKDNFKHDLLKEFPDGEGDDWVTETGAGKGFPEITGKPLNTQKINVGGRPSETIKNQPDY